MQRETFIHPMAVVEAGAELGVGVRIGPFCHIGADVRLGDNVELVSHVTVMGATAVGDGTKIYPQAVLGAPPQNLKHKGSRTTLVIGRNCAIREAVTMHVGSDTNGGETLVGDNGNFFAYTHVAHDCVIGNNVTFANAATLAGHCEVGDNVIIGGLTALHQFVRVGHNAFLGGCSAVTGDVIPYGMVSGNFATLRGLNIIGMKRAGISRAEIYALREAYRMLFDRSHPLAENLERAKAAFAASPIVCQVLAFLDGHHKRHLTVPPLDTSGDDGADDEV